jgi:hypothetical protein
MTVGLWILFLMIIPVLAGIIMFIKFHTIDWRETLCSLGVALSLITVTLILSKCKNNSDFRTVSGRVTSVTYTPPWRAEWTETESYTVTDSKGHSKTKTRTVRKSRNYPAKYIANTTIGNFTTEQVFYKTLCNIGGYTSKLGYRPNYDSGDRYDYITYVKDDPEFCDYPVSSTVYWKNPLKGEEGLHNFRKISDNEAKSKNLVSYPKANTFYPYKVLGTQDVDGWSWHKMNSALCENMRVNLILLKLPGGMDQAKLQQVYWSNGKANDIVICYDGKRSQPADWCYVFGWSDSHLVKTKLESLFLEKPINSDIIYDIKNIIRSDFKPHDFTKYENRFGSVPIGFVIAAFIIMLISQGSLYYIFHNN